MGTVHANKELDYGKGSTSFSLKSVFYPDVTPCFDILFLSVRLLFLLFSILSEHHCFFPYIFYSCLVSLLVLLLLNYCDSTTLNFFSVFAFLLVLSLDTFFDCFFIFCRVVLSASFFSSFLYCKNVTAGTYCNPRYGTLRLRH